MRGYIRITVKAIRQLGLRPIMGPAQCKCGEDLWWYPEGLWLDKDLETHTC